MSFVGRRDRQHGDDGEDDEFIEGDDNNGKLNDVRSCTKDGDKEFDVSVFHRRFTGASAHEGRHSTKKHIGCSNNAKFSKAELFLIVSVDLTQPMIMGR